MTKISIDLKTHAGDVPEEETIIPTQRQIAQAFAGALFTTKLIGKAEEYLEVIKIEFSQRDLNDTRKREGSILILRMTAILSNWQDKNEKIEASMESLPNLTELRSKTIAQELVEKINMAMSAHIESKKCLTESWQDALDSSIKNSETYFSKDEKTRNFPGV